jgi:hypothetical protein
MGVARTKSVFAIPLILLLSALFLLHTPVAQAAEKASPKQKAAAKTKATTGKSKTATRSTKAKSQANSTKAPAAPVQTVSEEEAKATFDTFTLEWMEKLAKNEDFQRTQQTRVSPTTDGVICEYTGYLPQRFIAVKSTKSSETPYVGSLTYYEKTMRCVGKTKEEAIKAPCEEVGKTPVKEIFRFTKGKWVY